MAEEIVYTLDELKMVICGVISNEIVLNLFENDQPAVHSEVEE